MDIEYIERILRLRQELIDDPDFDNKKIKVIDTMFENFMDINYKININVSLNENMYDIMSKLIKNEKL